ncbi:uncharacterized protein LOC117480927, partial [Trematomus bernacchii]|uniref:uncharacterized protein LOC117480927 n=1 Tax=Trematomus bernacchii TaxID=40690 RepID=UPI00146B08F5
VQVSERLSDRWSIVQAVSPLDLPQLNPLHDGSFSQLKEAVEQMVAEKQSQWDDFLDPVLFLFRTSSNPTTKFSPYSLMFSRKPDLPNQTTLSLLSYHDQEQDEFSTTEKASSFLSAMQEQQNSVKQLPWQHITPTLFNLHWLPVKSRITYKLLLLTYKSLHALSPQYLTDLLHPYIPSRTLRSSDSGLLSIPHSRLRTFGDRAFSVAAPTLWNSLPAEICNAPSLNIFISTLKTHLFNIAFQL